MFNILIQLIRCTQITYIVQRYKFHTEITLKESGKLLYITSLTWDINAINKKCNLLPTNNRVKQSFVIIGQKLNFH